MSAAKKQKATGLPPHVERQRTHVDVRPHGVHNSSFAYRSHEVDDSFNLQKFQENFKINFIEQVVEEDGIGSSLVFDMIGVDPSIANAFRRILVSEVPTMAIEKVYIYNNTSLIQDEVLSHRLGLVPLRADPKKFIPLKGEDFTTDNTFVLALQVTCERRAGVPDSAPDDEKYIHSKVYSKDLIFKPEGIQEGQLTQEDVGPLHDDILLAKLRPGQQIDLLAYVTKGVGKEHAKWSPVATASYRLLPVVTLKEPITGTDARTLVNLCPMKVFDIEDLGSVQQAKVANVRNCSMCRECIREPAWEKRVQLERAKNHFIFSIESVGAIPPKELLKQAIEIFIQKLEDVEYAIQLKQNTE